MRFSGRVYVVTGGTQGIGEAVAMRVAGEGARGVVITGRNEERGRGVAKALADKGAEAVFVAAELEDPAQCRKVLAACDARFGRVDGLVNCAGLTSRGTLESTTVELWDRLFAVNVRAPFILSQDAARIMKREKIRGAIVNVLSMSSHGGQPFLMAYSTTKGALATLTKNLGHALRGDRIRVNGINLGWTTTPGEDSIQKETGAAPDWLEKAEKAQPFGRLIRPGDLANLAAFLLSDDAEMMTGSLVDLDQNVNGAYE